MTATRSAVVTGAGSGIGRAVAARLAADGWVVVGVDRDRDRLDTAMESLRASGARAHGVVGDVADRRTHRTARSTATQEAPLAAWVGAAGITQAHELTNLDEAEVRALIDVNALGMLWGAAEAVEEWLDTASPGVIVIVSSVHARHAYPNHAVYEMSKAAVEALTRNIAVSYGSRGIRAVAVAPGAVITPALESSLASAPDPEGARRHLEQQTPAERLARPEEIAASVSFVVSDEASYLSGTTLTIDGGWSAVLARAPRDPSSARPVTRSRS